MIDFKEKANLIWAVADLLRGDYKQVDYGKVILPMAVLRRLECVLEPTKQKVLDYLPKVAKMSEAAIDLALNKVAGFNFYNRSLYNFGKLGADPNNIAANLRNFINGKYFAYGRLLLTKFHRNDDKGRLKLDNEVALEYYRLQKISAGSITLEIQNEVGLTNITEAGIQRQKEESSSI